MHESSAASCPQQLPSNKSQTNITDKQPSLVRETAYQFQNASLQKLMHESQPRQHSCHSRHSRHSRYSRPKPQPPQPFRMLKSHWNKFQICKKSEMHIVLVKNMSNPKWLSSRSKRSYHIDPRTRIKWIWNATVWATLDPQTWKCCPMSSLQNHRTIFRDKHMRSERRRMYNTHLPRIVITNFNVECIGREKTQTINLPWVDPRPVETKLVWTNKCRSLPNMLTWHHQRINALFLSDLFRVSTVSLFFDLCRIWRRRKIK